MVDVAEIKLWGQLVGAVRWEPNRGLGSFQYAPEFLRSGLDLAPIKMPLSQGVRVHSFPELRSREETDTYRGLPGLLADTLPDKYGNRLIQLWLAQNGRSSDSMNPVELLCFIGERGMGALEFEPILQQGRQTSFSIELESLVVFAQKILDKRRSFVTNLKEDEQKAMSDILKVGTSAGGARPKAVIAFNERTGEVRSGQAKVDKGFSHWILKLDGVSEEQFGESHGYGRVEMAYYRMALEAGIEMSECRLLEENGRAHFMTRRFDRDASGEKLHMQSLCAIRHFDFNMVGYYSYEQVFETMRILHLPYPQAEQMFRRMVFNVLARNCDDHTKNFAFLMNREGEWRLSPAFDLCYAYRPGSHWVSKQSLQLNGKREGFDRDDLMEVARQMNIKKAASVIDEVAAVMKNWPNHADACAVPVALKEVIGKNLLLL